MNKNATTTFRGAKLVQKYRSVKSFLKNFQKKVLFLLVFGLLDRKKGHLRLRQWLGIA